MQPEHLHFGGGSSATILHPWVAVGMLVAIVLIFVLPREKAITPFLLAFFTIPVVQVVVLGGVHFTMHQILIFAVLARMAASGRGGRFVGGFNALDRVAVLCALSGFIIFSTQWMETQATIKCLGDLVITLGGYLAVRFLIPDRETLRRSLKVLALICVIQGLCMVSEQFTAQNVFAFAGGPWPDYRNGHIRAQGAMGGLYAGTMAGALIPLFLWLWTEAKSGLAASAGIAGATAMVFVSHASTCWLTFGGSLLGLCVWPLRRQMRLIRWGIVATLVGLHLVMHGPVWSLIEKVDLTGGSSSYHRYMLVDNCIRHFSNWWLIGYRYYASWGFDMWDLCNQFVATALGGGLVTLVLFIMIYSRSFGLIGRAGKQVEGDRHQEWLLWCLGSALFGYVVASFGINYMVYLTMCFFTLLVCVSVATFEATRLAEVKVETIDDSHPASVPNLVGA
jgi:hypothetical protein